MRALLCSLSLLFASGGSSAATVWDEAIDGDLSGTPSAPTVVTFAPGSNVVANASVDPASDIRDYFTFTLQADQVLAGITLLGYGGNAGFTSINAGATSFFPSTATADRFLGGVHVDASMIGPSLLTLMATASITGAGFATPLGPGAYTFLMQQTSGEVTPYALDFEVQVVPLPASVWLLATGLVLVGTRGRARLCRSGLKTRFGLAGRG